MNLRIIQPDTTKGITGRPTVNFATNGSIGMTPKSIEKIKAREKETISFVQDEDKPTSWYLMLDPDGVINLRHKNKGGGAASSSSMTNKVYDSFGHSGKKALKFILGEPITWEGHQLYPLDLVNATLELVVPKDNKIYEFQKPVAR